MTKMLHARLGDICRFKAGNAFKKKLQGRSTGDYPFIKVSDMNHSGNEISITRSENWVDQEDVDENRYNLHEAGSVVFAKIGIALTYNRRCTLRQPTIIDNNMMAAKPKTNLVTDRYFYYLLSTLDFNEIASGSALPYLTQKDLQRIDVSLHQIPEQILVASLLGVIDDKIDLNRRMNETLEAMARAIFKDWFVDFGPVREKMGGRAPYLAPEIWKLFPDALDGEGIPFGWEVSEIGREVNTVGGATPSTKDSSFWEGGEFHWATPKDLSKLLSPVLLETNRKITEAGVRKISSGLLPIGTLLMSSRAPIGYLAISEVPTAVNQGFIAMVCEKRIPNIFVVFWCHENLDHIIGIAGGSTFAEISKRVFRSIPVVVPTQRIVEEFERLVRPLYSRIVANMKEAESLANMRDYLLPKLMSGEIRLRDAEKAVEAAA